MAADFQIWICGEHRDYCSTVGCTRRAHYACDYPISVAHSPIENVLALAERVERGAKGKEARTCSRPLCERCAINTLIKDKHFCPPHAKRVQEKIRK